MGINSNSIILPDLSDIEDCKGLLVSFFEAKILKKERLRTYVYDQLQTIQARVDNLIYSNDKTEFWQKVHDLAYLSKDTQAISSINQIFLISKSIKEIISQYLKDSYTLELSIKLKAAEISSGDAKKDYYLAMKIRNDQLLAYLYVFSESLNMLDNCLLYQPQEILKHPSFLFFGIKSIDDRVYEIAQKLYETRIKLNLI